MNNQADGLKKLVSSVREKDILYSTDPMGNISRVICITSGKGGVGKSNLSVNLSLALSQQGLRVVLFDGDLGMANVDVLMGLYPPYNLTDFLYEKKTLQEIMALGPCGLKVIPGGSGITQLANATPRQQNRFINGLLELEDEVDLVLIDTSAGLGYNVLRFVSAAHELIVVTTPEPTAITDAYSIIKVVSNYKLHSRVGLVVNRVRSEEEALQTARKIERVSQRYLDIKVQYLGSVYEDVKVGDAVRNQVPFVISHPRCKAAESVRKLAGKLNGDFNSQEEKQGFSGFVKKMFKLLS